MAKVDLSNLSPRPAEPNDDHYEESAEDFVNNIDEMFGKSFGDSNFRPAEEEEEEEQNEVKNEEEEEENTEEEEDDEENDEEEVEEDDEDEEDEEDAEEDEDEDVEEEEEPIAAKKKEEKEKAPDIEATLLRLKVQQLEKELAAKEAAAKAAPKEPAKKASEDEEVESPQYGLQIPNEMVELISEATDPAQFKMGMEAIINGTAQVIHKQVLESVQKQIEQALSQNVPQMIEGQKTREKAQSDIREDFFSHYPGYNDPKYLPILAHVAQDIDARLGSPAYSPEVREAMALKMRELIGNNGKADSAGPNGRRRRQQKKRRSSRKGSESKKMIRGGSRQGSGRKDDSEGDALANDFQAMYGSVTGRRKR